MGAYFAVFFLLIFLHFVEMFDRRWLLPIDLLALIVFVLFGGLRFETGNDWVFYRDFYDELPNILFQSAGGIDWNTFEPLYVLLSLVSKTFIDFGWFIFIIILFNGLVLFLFCQKNDAPFAGVFSIYFAWIYLASQMAAIRHSIAISFILISFHYALRARHIFAISFFLISIGFHFSTILFVPLYLLMHFKPKFITSFLLIFFSSLFFYLFFNSFFLDFFASMPIMSKVVFYVKTSSYSKISTGSVIYIALNLLFLFYLSRCEDSYLKSLSCWATVYLLSFQLGLWFYPVYWNRIMVLVVVFQASFLCINFINHKLFFYYIITIIICGLFLFKQLSDSASISYVPYQNVIIEEAFNVNNGEGERRFFEALDVHVDRNVNQ